MGDVHIADDIMLRSSMIDGNPLTSYAALPRVACRKGTMTYVDNGQAKQGRGSEAGREPTRGAWIKLFVSSAARKGFLRP